MSAVAGGAPGPAARRALAALAVTSACALGGCSSTLFQQVRFESGRDPSAVAGALAAGAPPSTKAEALERLGAPLEVVGLADGELFVYRLRRTRLDVLNLHTGFGGLPSVPLYVDVRGEQRDGLLLVRFDRLGRVTGIAGPARP